MILKEFKQQFTIHPVGQGLFYSCRIKQQQKVVFRMVFDCGSKTSGVGQEEVKIYRDDDFLKEKRLDLLIISHFDSDHVNHIGKLLADGIKIKRLIMPFISFEERLFLALKLLTENRGYNNDIDYTINLIIDPVKTLADNLDNDSELYLVTSDPNAPISPTIDDNLNVDSRNDTRLTFEFPSKSKKQFSKKLDITIPYFVKGKLFEVKDSVKGYAVDPQKILLLINFLFYRKSISKKEEDFYAKVKELFCSQKEIDISLSNNELLEAVYEKIKMISSSKEIITLFKNAAGQTNIPLKDVSNLNTTSLCMLHVNLPSIKSYVAEEIFDASRHHISSSSHIYSIQKFLANVSSRIIKEESIPFIFDNYSHWKYYSKTDIFHKFPNVLLTSDCFLLGSKEVEEFLNKYKHYLLKFWLFQIPHHGSKNNSGAVLHSNVPSQSSCFINYGTDNNHDHPSADVIKSLVANGLSNSLFSINEFKGVIFTINLRISNHHEL